MGCKGSKNVKYDFKDSKRSIPIKHAKTLDRWSLGAHARIKVMKMKRDEIKKIIGLPKPCLVDGELAVDPNPKSKLMKYDDFLKIDNKEFIWDNYWEDISEKGDPKGTRQYRGQRQKKKYKYWKGVGEIKYADGALYQGQTNNYKFNGKGRMTHPNGDIYQGTWTDGTADGEGTFVQVTTGSTFDGDWVSDTQHGQGVETWENGRFKYTGTFDQGIKTGFGRLDYDGNIYEGNFLDGEFHGKGKFYNAKTKMTQEGTFENNTFVKGSMLFEDGSYYDGGFKKGKMDGPGTIYHPNGNVFVGTFKDGQKNGLCHLYDFENECKVREDWQKGVCKDRIKTPTEPDQLRNQLEQQQDAPTYGNGAQAQQTKQAGNRMKTALGKKIMAQRFNKVY